MQLPDRSIGALEHVGLVMEDLDAAHTLFAKKLRLPVTRYPAGPDGDAFAVRAGGTVLRVVGADAPEAVAGRPGCNHLAFRVSSLAETRARLESLGVELASPPPAGSGGREAIWTAPKETVGIPLQFLEEPATLEFPPAPPDAFIERVDHLGVACRDHAHARRLYAEGLGFPIESTQIDSEVLIPVETTSNDKYGAATHTRAPITPIGSGLMALFITVGDLDLEIMQPLSPARTNQPLGTIPGSVGQDQGAIARYLERRGEGLLHICFKTPDVDLALKAVSEAGIELIDPVARPGGRAGRIAFMYRRSTEGVLMHFVERTPL